MKKIAFLLAGCRRTPAAGHRNGRLLLLSICAVQPVIAQAPVKPITTITKNLKSTSGVTAVLGAFADEVTILEAQVQQKKISIIQGIQFTQGILNGRKVVIAQTGIGKVNAAITTTLMLDHFKPQQVIFTGIAGGVNSELSPGDIVIGTLVAHHDYGTITPDSMLIRATRNPSTMVENPVYFPGDSSLVELAEKVSTGVVLETLIRHNSRVLPRIVKGIIVTGDVFVSSVTATQLLRKRTMAEATEMEGAAVAQACWQQRTPFLIIRSLSDNAGDNAYEDVKKFYQVAARNSASLVMAILGKLTK